MNMITLSVSLDHIFDMDHMYITERMHYRTSNIASLGLPNHDALC